MLKNIFGRKKQKKMAKEVTTIENRVPADKVNRMRLSETLDYLRVNYDDLTPGQQAFFNMMLDCSSRDGIDEDRQRMLYNIAMKHKGNQTLIVRSRY